MRHNLVLAIMPPHIRGVPFIFYLTHGSAAIAATPMGLRYAAHIRGLTASPTP